MAIAAIRQLNTHDDESAVDGLPDRARHYSRAKKRAAAARTEAPAKGLLARAWAAVTPKGASSSRVDTNRSGEQGHSSPQSKAASPHTRLASSPTRERAAAARGDAGVQGAPGRGSDADTVPRRTPAPRSQAARGRRTAPLSPMPATAAAMARGVAGHPHPHPPQPPHTDSPVQRATDAQPTGASAGARTLSQGAAAASRGRASSLSGLSSPKVVDEAARRAYLETLPSGAGRAVARWHDRRRSGVTGSTRGMGLNAPARTTGSLLPSAFERCTRLLALKHKMTRKRFTETPTVTTWRRKRAAFGRSTLGVASRIAEPGHAVGTVKRLDLLETAMLDMASKVDLLLAAQGLRHPTLMRQGLWPQPASFARRTWDEMDGNLNLSEAAAGAGGAGIGDEMRRHGDS